MRIKLSGASRALTNSVYKGKIQIGISETRG